MDLHILSDLHLEFAPFQPTAPRSDLITVLAGDIHTGVRGIEWAAESFQGCPIVFILGNHEFYGHAAPTPFPAIAAQQRMTDFRKIRVSPQYRRLRPADTVLWFHRSVSFLRREFTEPFAGPTVVVTHHAPSARSVRPSLATDEVSAAYASNLDDLIAESGAALWVHGHTHHNTTYSLGATRVITNQRGYPDEPVPHFDPELLVHI